MRLGASVTATDGALNTPLHYAAAFNAGDVEASLLHAGADAAATNEGGQTVEEVRGLGAKLLTAPTEDVLWVRPAPTL